MSVQHVTEFPATAPEQIEFFAQLLSRSEDKRRVFVEIYRGQSKNPKTAQEISRRVKLTPKRVLELATPLAANNLFEKTRHAGKIAYKKYPIINTVKAKILRLATNKQKLAAHVTVRNPSKTVTNIQLRVTPGMRDVVIDVRNVTIDEIGNFSKVRALKVEKLPSRLEPPRLPESAFKNGVVKILGNRGTFQDWGGEKNDLFSTHFEIEGKRYAGAIAFKGPATSGILTPGKMGKNGDQIQRLLSSAAQVFIVQYEGQIAESVLEQMRRLAAEKSMAERQRIYYGTIGLEDSYRLRLMYATQFAAPEAPRKKKRKSGRRSRRRSG